MRQQDKSIAKLEALTLRMIKKDNDFFDLETINPTFFATGESKILAERDTLNKEVQREIQDLKNSSVQSTPFLLTYIVQTENYLESYNEKFRKLVELVSQRGFKDYGLEGEMRDYAHQLEANAENCRITIGEILSLRRNEKDFMIRNEVSYIERFNLLSNELKQRVLKESRTWILLDKYQNTFNELTQLQVEIGINSNEGLRNELNRLTDQISENYEDFLRASEEHLSQAAIDLKIILFLVFVLAVFISIVIGLKIAIKLSRPIKKLSGVMAEVVENQFTAKPKYKLSKPTNEIADLSESFTYLMTEMEHRIGEINEKSEKLKSQNYDLSKLNSELDHFLYSTAHDLRSPLTSLLGLINLSLYENKDDRILPYFKMMQESIKKMEKFIADVVIYAKNSKTEREIEKINLKGLIDNLIDYNQQFSSKEVKFEIVIEGEYDLFSDKSRLKVILNNLISNAIKYQDHNKAHRFASIKVLIERKKVSLQFSDNGIGISSEHQHKIFDMFYRATEHSKGSGLGLYLLKEAVHKLNGKVEALASPGQGTTFYLEFENFSIDVLRPHQISLYHENA
ncbi:sensor histidine kinase [Marivirga sp.]|uniref:sensor histidine kinase n=1 Tax=Marivirga sp. TaxID=2018662 RepID=UPI003DA6FFDD